MDIFLNIPFMENTQRFFYPRVAAVVNNLLARLGHTIILQGS